MGQATSNLELVVSVDHAGANASISQVNRGLDSIGKTALASTRAASSGMDSMAQSMAKSATSSIQQIERLEDEVVRLTQDAVRLRQELEQHPEKHKELSAALQQVQFQQRTARTELRNLTFAQRDANENLQVLANSFGVRLPDALTRFTTRLPGVQSALGSAFRVGVVAAFGVALGQMLARAIVELTQFQSTLQGIKKTIGDVFSPFAAARRDLILQNKDAAAAKISDAVLGSQERQRKLAQELSGVGLSGAGKLRNERDIALADLQKDAAASGLPAAVRAKEEAAITAKYEALIREENKKTAEEHVKNVRARAEASRKLIEEGQKLSRAGADAAISEMQRESDALRQQLTERNRDEAQALEAIQRINREAALANLDEWQKTIQQQAFAYEEMVAQIAEYQKQGLIDAAQFNEALKNLAVQAAADTQEVLDRKADKEAAEAKKIADANQRVFEGFKRQAEGVFDALVARTRNFWDFAKVTAITALKEIVTSNAARIMMQLFGGGGAAAGAGNRGFSLAGLVGLGGIGGGFGTPGAPGGTGGFAGPVGGVATAGLGVGGSGLAGLSGLLGPGAVLAGGLASLGLLRRGGVGGAVGAAGLAASGIAGAGLLTGLGIGAGFGPVGLAIVGAAAGVGALIGLFRKKPEEKIREAIKKLYAVDIRDNGILKQIYEITRQYGSISLGIASPQVREIVELYSLTTWQTSNLAPKPVTSVFAQTSAGLFSLPPLLNGAPAAAPLRIDAPAGGAPSSLTIPVMIGGEVVETMTVNAMIKNNRIVAAAAVKGGQSNVGRRENAALMFSPGLVMR